jgi:hypothetical protein
MRLSPPCLLQSLVAVWPWAVASLLLAYRRRRPLPPRLQGETLCCCTGLRRAWSCWQEWRPCLLSRRPSWRQPRRRSLQLEAAAAVAPPLSAVASPHPGLLA